MTQEEILAFLTRKRTQEELREYVNPDGKLNYFGTQKILNDYCNSCLLYTSDAADD